MFSLYYDTVIKPVIKHGTSFIFQKKKNPVNFFTGSVLFNYALRFFPNSPRIIRPSAEIAAIA